MNHYKTVADAEQAIRDAGFRREVSRAMWVHPTSGKTARVVRAGAFGLFTVEWS